MTSLAGSGRMAGIILSIDKGLLKRTDVSDVSVLYQGLECSVSTRGVVLYLSKWLF